MLLMILILRSINEDLNEIFFKRSLKLRIINSFKMKFDNFKSISSLQMFSKNIIIKILIYFSKLKT